MAQRPESPKVGFRAGGWYSYRRFVFAQTVSFSTAFFFLLAVVLPAENWFYFQGGRRCDGFEVKVAGRGRSSGAGCRQVRLGAVGWREVGLGEVVWKEVWSGGWGGVGCGVVLASLKQLYFN